MTEEQRQLLYSLYKFHQSHRKLRKLRFSTPLWEIADKIKNIRNIEITVRTLEQR